MVIWGQQLFIIINELKTKIIAYVILLTNGFSISNYPQERQGWLRPYPNDHLHVHEAGRARILILTKGIFLRQACCANHFRAIPLISKN